MPDDLRQLSFFNVEDAFKRVNLCSAGHRTKYEARSLNFRPGVLAFSVPLKGKFTVKV